MAPTNSALCSAPKLLPETNGQTIEGMRTETGLAAAMQVGRLFAGDGAATQGELVVRYQPVFQTG